MDTPQTPITPKPKFPFINIILVIFALFVIGEVIYLSYLKTRVNSGTSPTPTETVGQKAYWDTFDENCGVKPEENPLINSLVKNEDYTTGSVHGNIEKIEYSEKAAQAKVLVRSIDGKQGHDFTLDEVPNLVYEHLKPTTIRSLQPGAEVTISFQCEKKTNYAFDLTRVTINSQRPFKPQ